MTRTWWKASAWNAIAALVGIAASFLVLSLILSFSYWELRPITDSIGGRFFLAIASVWWIRKAGWDGPFKVGSK